MDLELGAGEVLGVLGPNGSGKSTLLRGALGLMPPLAGEAWRAEGCVGYVPQRDTLDASFPISVEEVVHLGAYGRLGGLRRLSAGDRSHARACLERVGMDAARKHLFSALSGGQRQRVLIARALMERPRLMVLDEPTTGVDRPTVELILGLLEELRTAEGLAVLFVSHEVALLRGMVEEVLWVQAGRVRRGPAAELLAPERLDALYAGRRES